MPWSHVIAEFCRWYPAYKPDEVLRLPYFLFNRFREVYVPSTASKQRLAATQRNEADEATDRITRLFEWQAKRDARRKQP